ncbi:bifunctional folylpolyglutamate synthase/dihydrofolate synthase [Flavobacteriales bacterium]|nr:bifunctional folylpolyglutamate synthase/dihydrofolate synthase [Flavobacteriales bacterium]
MNYEQTIDFLFTQFPAYQKHGGSAFKPGLERVLQLSELADNPHQKFKSIHLAGTNGKGSCSHMLASILQEAGYKVGLFTSPHLKDFRERIKLNGQEIDKQYVIDFVKEFKSEAEAIEPSFFEYTTIMAFKYFAEQKVDIAIIETGLGGRLDCSNIILPKVSVITNIGLDHVQFLGDNLPAIAGEKAGIIKPNTPVVIGRKQGETITVFDYCALQNKAEIIWAEEIECNYELDLKGYYQKENAKTVYATIKELAKQGWNISEENIASGFLNTVKNTSLQGRWQILQTSPTVICDTGHNIDGVRIIASQIEDLQFEKLHIVWGMVDDKDIETILNLLPKVGFFYWCSPDIGRALDVKKLMKTGAENNCMGLSYLSVKEAKKAAIANAKENDLVFIGGSTFVVAEAIV